MSTSSIPAVEQGAPGGPVGAAVARARRAFASGRTRDLAWRRGQLLALEAMLAAREDELLDALADDLGRPRVDAWLADLSSVTAESRYARRHLRRWARRRFTTVPAGVQPGIGSWKPEPLGVVAVVGPWNYPVYLALAPVVAALAAGNTVVLKPSEHAPATAAVLARLLPGHLDPEAVVVVAGGPAETQELVGGDVDHVFFTGSPEVGAAVMATAARRLTPVTLELGGKSPVIVDRHADVPVAARRVAWTKLMNSGQTCVAPDYVLVDRAVAGAFVDELTTALAQLRPDRSPQPIVNTRHAGRLEGLLADHGGEVVTGGVVDVAAGTVEPTVILDPDPSSRLMQEEIFGPILPVRTVADLEEALTTIAAGPSPLATYVFSRSAAVARAVRDRVRTGGVVVNHTMFHVLVPQLPFGGVGRSGMGAYHGQWGFDALSHRKPTLHKPSRPDPSVVYPPYSRATERLLRRLF